ncbi:MAG: hypothetical protein ACXVFQ_01590 [Solirubrobacteraceae bacterium]
MHSGTVTDPESIERALSDVSPADGTNIASALNAAADHKAATADAGVSQIMLISDGKSDRADATAAARRCLANGLALSMLLIDPSENFIRSMARRTAFRYAVMSFGDPTNTLIVDAGPICSGRWCHGD